MQMNFSIQQNRPRDIEKNEIMPFPGGTVDKNPPANAGNTSSIPEPQ